MSVRRRWSCRPTVPRHEMARTVASQRELGRAVCEAVAAGELPIVLAGNCSTAVGTLAARPAGSVVVWFDAHADFNTAETTVTGMLDGLALSMVTGRALRSMTKAVEGFVPVDESHVILVGARDLDAAEEQALAASPVASHQRRPRAVRNRRRHPIDGTAVAARVCPPRPGRPRPDAGAGESVRRAGWAVAGGAGPDPDGSS